MRKDIPLLTMNLRIQRNDRLEKLFSKIATLLFPSPVLLLPQFCGQTQTSYQRNRQSPGPEPLLLPPPIYQWHQRGLLFFSMPDNQYPHPLRAVNLVTARTDQVDPMILQGFNQFSKGLCSIHVKPGRMIRQPFSHFRNRLNHPCFIICVH